MNPAKSTRPWRPLSNLLAGCGGGVADSKIWRVLTTEFETVAREEAPQLVNGARREGLQASCMYGPENPQFGSVQIYNAVNGHIQSRFEDIATTAGIAMNCPENVRPLEFWIHCLCQDLRKRNSPEIFPRSKEGGIVVAVIASSASYCLRLATAAQEEEHRARLQEMAATNRQGIAEAAMLLPPDLPDTAKRRLQLQWISILEINGFTTAGISRYQAGQGAVDRSIAAALKQLQNIDSEYWPRWNASGTGYEIYEIWLNDASKGILEQVEEVWKKAPGFPEDWYERVCAPAVASSLTSHIKSRVKLARQAELQKLQSRKTIDPWYVNEIRSDQFRAAELRKTPLGSFANEPATSDPAPAVIHSELPHTCHSGSQSSDVRAPSGVDNQQTTVPIGELVDIYISEQWRVHGGPPSRSVREELRDRLVPIVIKAFGSVEFSLDLLLKESSLSDGVRIRNLIRAYELHCLRMEREAVEENDHLRERFFAGFKNQFHALVGAESEMHRTGGSKNRGIRAVLRTEFCHLPDERNIYGSTNRISTGNSVLDEIHAAGGESRDGLRRLLEGGALKKLSPAAQRSLQKVRSEIEKQTTPAPPHPDILIAQGHDNSSIGEVVEDQGRSPDAGSGLGLSGASASPLTTAAASQQPVIRKTRGRPIEISDELKEKALLVAGGKARAQILYKTHYPTPQQVKNVPTILKNYKKKRDHR